MITDIRLAGQQLAAPRFDTPKKLVSWMGAIQAQDYAMARWAVGIRLKSATPLLNKRPITITSAGLTVQTTSPLLTGLI